MIGRSGLMPRSVPKAPSPSDAIVGLLALFGSERHVAERFLIDCRETLDHNKTVLEEAKALLVEVAKREAAVSDAEAVAEQNHAKMVNVLAAANAAAQSQKNDWERQRAGIEANLQSRVSAFDARAVELDQREKAAIEKATAIDRREAAVDQREKAIAGRELLVATTERRLDAGSRKLREILDAKVA